MRWIDRAGDCARRYQQNRRELGRIRRYARKPQGIRGNGISRPVEAEVFSCCDESRAAQLEREIEAVEFAFAKMKQIAEKGDTVSVRDIARNTVKLAEVVYIKRSHGLVGASVLLNFSERTAKRYNQHFLRLVAAKMGFLPH